VPITYLRDRHSKADLEIEYPEVARSLRARWSLMMENKKELVAWVGIARACGNDSVVFLPHGGPARNEFASRLMSAIVRFARENRRSGEALHDNGPNQAALLADLAADFRDHGIYFERERVRTRNSGKPDWGRTARQTMAFPDSDDRPIYLEIATTRPATATTNVIATIQRDVISELARDHGWWLRDHLGSRELPRPVRAIPWPRHIWPALLRSARRGLYQERAIRLVRMLLAYLEIDEKTGDGGVICGVSDFSTMWEAMLRDVLPRVDTRWNDELPGPYYFKTAGAPEASGRMQMDIVVRHDRRLLVIDAKYYRATSVGLAPGWADIVKQLYYVKALETVRSARNMKIGTAFIFPGIRTEAAPFDRVEMLGRGGETLDAFPSIACQYLGMDDVVTAYARRSKLCSTPWLGALLERCGPQARQAA
jgi:hypothetical protein